jgi:hypothetical protein
VREKDEENGSWKLGSVRLQVRHANGKPGGEPTQPRGDQRSSGDGKSKRSGAQKIAQTPPPPFVVRGDALGQRCSASHLQCNEQFQLSHPALTGMRKKLLM